MAESSVQKQNNPYNIITCFYNDQRAPGEVPMKGLSLDIHSSDGADEEKGWGEINDEPKDARYTAKKIISVVCSPEALKDQCNMVIFSVDDAKSKDVSWFGDF